MADFHYAVTVTAETKEQADMVMTERLNHEESYGFDYSIEWGEEHLVIDLRNGER